MKPIKYYGFFLNKNQTIGKMKHTNETIINKLKNIFINEDFSYENVDYKGYNEKIIVTCKKHGDFSKTPKQLSLGKGCPSCSYNKPTIQKLISKFNKIHNNMYEYNINKYENNRQYIDIYCRKHGYFKQTINNHLNNGCPKCAGKKLNNDLFIEKSNIIHNNAYSYLKANYKGNKSVVTITCNKHGDFTQIANDHLMGHGCPICKSSKGEKIIANFLNENNIKYETQKKFIDCKDNRQLPFDFWIPDRNMCIEYDGRQHFEIIEKWGGEEALIDRIKKDTIKDNFCKSKGIDLLRIRYDEDVEKVLFLKFNMKECKKCNKFKEYSEFYKDKSTKDGYKNKCKQCCNEYMKSYRKTDKNKKYRKAYDKKRYAENREYEIERKKKYYWDNRII